MIEEPFIFLCDNLFLQLNPFYNIPEGDENKIHEKVIVDDEKIKKLKY